MSAPAREREREREAKPAKPKRGKRNNSEPQQGDLNLASEQREPDLFADSDEDFAADNSRNSGFAATGNAARTCRRWKRCW